MADLTFYKKLGLIVGFRKAWKVSSGIKGRFASIPPKSYKVPPWSLSVGTKRVPGVPFNAKYSKPAYLDKNNFGWFLWLGVAGYGIHPDGNVPGTEGCIGLTNPDTRDLFEELRKKHTSGFEVLVTDQLAVAPIA